MNIQKDKQVYRSDNLIVAAKLPSVWLQLAWEIMLREDLLDIVFYEARPERDWFLKQYSLPEVTTFGCFEQGLDPDPKFCGFGRIAPYSMGNNFWKGEIAVCFFKEFQKRKYTLPFAKMMVEHAFDNYVFHSLFGTTPLPNKAMLYFIRSLGFQGTEVPAFTTWKGEPCGIYLSWMTKEMWRSLRQPDSK